MQISPKFGQADLSNCERELIHLAASVQPHGVLFVIDESSFIIVQATLNVGALLGVAHEVLVSSPVALLGGDLEARLRAVVLAGDLATPAPLQCHAILEGRRVALLGAVHRHVGGDLIVELELVDDTLTGTPMVGLSDPVLLDRLASSVQMISHAATLPAIADAAVRCYRDLTGYDRVMVYKFDPDGHGTIIAEAREPRLDALLGHHYPASDIPQRARQLYLRTRLRVLVDVHYEPSPILPRLHARTGEDLDMSLCYLRSMSPLHLQYLKNMGVTATLVVSLVREGRLWGLIAAHHYSPRNLKPSLRLASEMLAEVIATRIAAVENYAHAQVPILARRLEQRLIDATSIEGDWRQALFRNPRSVLQPLEATGAALFSDGEILTAGEVPSTPELRVLMDWVHAHATDAPFSCSSVGRENPALASLTPIASGVLAVKLSAANSDYLMWFRKEQLTTVTWAGDPTKAVIGNDPMDLSPRRSFAAWAETVRGTAVPWSSVELALARAIGVALVDVILQVRAVRLLIAQHQITHIRKNLSCSAEPVVISDPAGKILLCNSSFDALVGTDADSRPAMLDDIARLFAQFDQVDKAFAALMEENQPWRAELSLTRRGAAATPVSLRAEIVPGVAGSVLGFILIVVDLTDRHRSAAARQALEQSLSSPALYAAESNLDALPSREPDAVVHAILANASLAAMDIADASPGISVAPLLEELEISTKRAAALYSQLRTQGTPHDRD